MSIGILGANGFIGGGLMKCSPVTTAITRENYQDHTGKYYDVIMNANGSAKKYWAETNPLADFDANVVSVYKSLVDFKYKKYEYLSSVEAYEPNTRYGFHKKMAEEIVQRHCQEYLILRVGAVIGKGMKKGVVYDLMNHQDLWVTDDSMFYLVGVNEIYSATLYAIDYGIENTILMVTGDRPISVKDMARVIGVDYKVRPEAQRYECDIPFELEEYPMHNSSEECLKEYIQNEG
jgi:dTDP-4-dehydrorhamnose reductase